MDDGQLTIYHPQRITHHPPPTKSMAFLFRCDSLGKTFGIRRLFDGISLSFDDGQRTGLIGPNGSGKSTLLKILAGLETPDEGTLQRRRNLRLGYVPQADLFTPGSTVWETMEEASTDQHWEPHDRDVRIASLLDRVGFTDIDLPIAALSGGWAKRLSIARQLLLEPDVLLLDEPTNHLDLTGIDWLEKLLGSANFAFLLVTHDRYFLEAVTNRTVELNPAYAGGFLSIDGKYSEFLEKKEQYLAAQASLEQSIAGRVRREVQWLQRGAKARTTKSKGRIDEAHRLMGELSDLKQRNAVTESAGVDFVGTHRQTRKLLWADKLSARYDNKTLFHGVKLTLSPGTKLGLLGPNGSGKSTLIRLLTGTETPSAGTVNSADGLRIVLFDQTRAALDQNQTLKDALTGGGETVAFRGNAMHVSAWAKRFLFRTQQLDMAVRDLSGGEQARVLVGRLMLQPADVLILDEPTNDLDISSLEVLEESLADFPGALVLVTHDRYMLDRLCTELWGLDGRGNAEMFAERPQYERWRDRPAEAVIKTVSKPAAPAAAKPKKLSYLEQREFESIEEAIHNAEETLRSKQTVFDNPAVLADHQKLAGAGRDVTAAQAEVDRLYQRWEELEAKR